nr:cupin domain-containing protein [Microterricola viridarii]
MQAKLPTVKGPAEWFTGDVYFNAYYAGEEPSRARLNLVRFTPGAHTAWHTHAVGQTLHVTEGLGYVQSRGGELIELHPGDTVHTPAGSGTGTARPPTTSCATSPSGRRRRAAANQKRCGAPSSATTNTRPRTRPARRTTWHSGRQTNSAESTPAPSCA